MKRSVLETYSTVDSILKNAHDLPQFSPLFHDTLTSSFEKLLRFVSLFEVRSINLSSYKYLLGVKKQKARVAAQYPSKRDISKHYTVVEPERGEELYRAAAPSAFGKGTETVHDEKVRRAKEIGASDLVVFTKRHGGFVASPISTLEGYLKDCFEENFVFSIKKLNVYGPGDFFAVHKDTPRSDAHVGTLVILLNDNFLGGEFVVIDNFGKEKIVKMDGQSNNGLIIYTDVDHEVRKVKSGYRMTLSVDIELKEYKGLDIDIFDELADKKKSLELPETNSVMELFKLICQQCWSINEKKERFGVLLYHQYVKGTSKNLLKGIDKRFYDYFKEKGAELSLVPLLLLKSGIPEGETSIKMYKLPNFFINPDDQTDLKKFLRDKDSDSSSKEEKKDSEKDDSSKSDEGKGKKKGKDKHNSDKESEDEGKSKKKGKGKSKGKKHKNSDSDKETDSDEEKVKGGKKNSDGGSDKESDSDEEKGKGKVNPFVEDNDSGDSAPKGIPLVIFTQPPVKLIKHIEGSEYTGNEGLNEEYFYYMTVLLIQPPTPPLPADKKHSKKK